MYLFYIYTGYPLGGSCPPILCKWESFSKR